MDDDEPDVDDDDEPDGDETDGDEPDDEAVIQFLDCHTVRIVGDFPEVVIYPLELIEPGDEPDQYFVGAMGSFPVGPVDGERVIDMREEIGERVIIPAVDVLDDEFTAGEPVHERIHPDRDECIGQLFVDAGVEPPDDPFGEVPAAGPDEDAVDDVPDDDENDELPDDDAEDDSDAEGNANGEEPVGNDEDDTAENIT